MFRNYDLEEEAQIMITTRRGGFKFSRLASLTEESASAGHMSLASVNDAF
jgi:hypothetical protein